MKKWVLADGVSYEMNGDELMIVNAMSGFTAIGNKHIRMILDMLSVPASEDDVRTGLMCEYDSSQHSRIEKSIPKIFEWLSERGLLVPA